MYLTSIPLCQKYGQTFCYGGDFLAKKKIVLPIVFIVCVFLALVCFNLPPKNTVPGYEYKYVELPTDFRLPSSKVIAVGFATHVNAETLDAAKQILQLLFEKNGDAVFILEENVGAGEKLNELYSFSDENSRHFGFYSMYASEEMYNILDLAQEKEIRIYGIDVQSTKGLDNIIYAKLDELGFERTADVKRILNYKPEKGSNLDLEKKKLVMDIEEFLNYSYRNESITQREFDYLSFLLDNIKMNTEYIQNGKLTADREKMMAKNVSWIVEYEEKYFGNSQSVLLASNGHIIKTPYSANGTDAFIETPMGFYLDEHFSSDYYAIVTDAQKIIFTASNRHQQGKKFFVEREGALLNYLNDTKSDVLFLDKTNYKTESWNLTVIGWYFVNQMASRSEFYTIPTTFDSYDAILLYRYYTPSHYVS